MLICRAILLVMLGSILQGSSTVETGVNANATVHMQLWLKGQEMEFQLKL